MNPGPYTPKYPCGVCKKAVRWSKTRTAVACDTCNTWYHTDCMGMTSEVYNRINRSDVSWICMTCDTPNHSSSLLDSYVSVPASENKFHPLSDSCVVSSSDADALYTSNSKHSSSIRTSSCSSIDSEFNPGSPLQQSSPINKTIKRRKNEPRPLKVLSVNLQSLNAKREAFLEAVESCQPDIIAANETWLKPSILSSEMMPPGFNPPIRKDRQDDPHGGVLLATKSDLIDGEIKINEDCELVATKIQLYNEQPLIVLSAYRPPNNDLPYTQTLCQAIRNVVAKNQSAVIWLTGDFNLPDINWASMSIIGHQYTTAVNNCFISTFNDLGLTQSVDFPTREENTLDLFVTNRPSLVTKCMPLPGVSDHEMVLTLSDIRARRQKPVQRKILLWKKADMNNIKSEINIFGNHFVSSNTIDTDVNDLWNQITSKLHSVMDTMVPSKLSSTRFSQPWITNHLKSLSRKKKRAFRRARKSKKNSDWAHYKNLKKIMQRDCKSAYHTYISDMLCEGEDGLKNPKRFWSYIKSKRCENSGVAPLMKDGTLQSDSSTKANMLNNQFVSVFTNAQRGCI